MRAGRERRQLTNGCADRPAPPAPCLPACLQDTPSDINSTVKPYRWPW